MRFVLKAAAAALFLILCDATFSIAQTPRPGSLRIVVRDATGLAISGAEVVVTAADGRAVAQTRTADSGAADVSGLPPGVYHLTVSAPGFEAAALSDLSVRADRRLTREVTLEIAGLVEDIQVQPPADDRTLAAASTTELTEDQLAALPEDPDELAEVLAQLAGADADIRVDGFADGTLPPGTQIQSIVIRYDESSSTSGGGPRVEIRTQPGGDRWRANMNARVRDEALGARNAFADERPSGRTQQYNWTVNGPLVRNRTGLSLSLERAITTDQQAVRAALPDGGLFSALLPRPSERLGIDARVEHAISPTQRLRVDIRQSNDDASNQGIGEFDLPERAYARTRQNGRLRVGHSTTLRSRITNDLRFVTAWSSSEATPSSTAPAIRVPGSLSMGGAQRQGGRASRTFEVENELRFTVRQRNQVSSGASVSGGHYHGDEWTNAGGTFTFASLDDLSAGRPTSYTQRLGNPAFDYALYRFSAYVQDDIRVRRNLVVNAGVRQEWQTHLSDWQNFSPRLGVNWTPSAKWRTSLRAGFSVSYQPFEENLFEQTLLVNGVRQSDLVIESPAYPDPLQGGLVFDGRPPGIIRADRGLVMPSTRRLTFGVDQPFGRSGRIRVTYSRQRGRHRFRSIDANAPVGGVRPDPAVRNLTLLQSAGRSLNDSLAISGSFNYPRYRLSANATYTYGEQRDDSDGPFALPPDSSRLDLEWGPSRQDVRHRFDLSANSAIGLGFRFNTNVRLRSASPYTITTGLDVNGDGVSNERPEGVGRNSGRGSGTRNIDFTLTWGHDIGERAMPPARAPRRGAAPPRANPWVRVELYVQAQNALNLVNPQSYSGVLTSPFFGRPTSAAAARRITLGFRLSY